MPAGKLRTNTQQPARLFLQEKRVLSDSSNANFPPTTVTVKISSFPDNTGHVVVTDSYICASTSSSPNPKDSGTYFPTVIWYDNTGVEIKRIACLQNLQGWEPDVPSVFPITPTIIARDDGGVTVQWIVWQYNSYNPNTSTRCFPGLSIVHCPPIPGPISGQIRTVSIPSLTDINNGYTPQFIPNLALISPKDSYVNMLSNSLSSARLPNGKSMTSSTQLKYDSTSTNYSIIFYEFNADLLKDAGLNNVNGGLAVATEPAQLLGMANSQMMLGTLVSLDADHVVEADYSAQDMTITMKLYDSNIKASANFFPTTKINGDHTIVKLAAYSYAVAAVCQSDYQIYLSILRININPFHVTPIITSFPISKLNGNSGYNNGYPDLLFLETGKLEVVWSRRSVNTIEAMRWQCDFLNDPQCEQASYDTLFDMNQILNNSLTLAPLAGDRFKVYYLSDFGQLLSSNYSALYPSKPMLAMQDPMRFLNVSLFLQAFVIFCLFSAVMKAAFYYFRDKQKEYITVPSSEIEISNTKESSSSYLLNSVFQNPSSYFQHRSNVVKEKMQKALGYGD